MAYPLSLSPSVEIFSSLFFLNTTSYLRNENKMTIPSVKSSKYIKQLKELQRFAIEC